MITKNCDTSLEQTNRFRDFAKKLVAVPKKEIDEQLKIDHEKKQKEKDKKRK